MSEFWLAAASDSCRVWNVCSKTDLESPWTLDPVLHVEKKHPVQVAFSTSFDALAVAYRHSIQFYDKTTKTQNDDIIFVNF
jgi:hypothetical protein